MLKRFLQSGIGAALAWVAASLGLAAVLTPWAWRGGKWLASAASEREMAGWIESIAGSCARAEIDRYFDRSLLLAALLLLPFLLRRLHRIGIENGGTGDVGTRFPASSVAAQIAIGCAIAAGLLGMMGLLLDIAGAYELNEDLPKAGKFLKKVLVPAVAAPLVEEWLFRGVLLGLWLRFARPAFAVTGTSLLFAFLHFLKPPDGFEIADPAHALAGFELLGKIMMHFTEPLFFVTDFATLFAVGLILAWARLRTGALWFSIGLHAGWIFAFKGFNMLYDAVKSHPLRPWCIGDSLKSGMLPLLMLAFTALVCRYALKPFSRASR